MVEYKSFLKRAGGSEGSRCLYPVRLVVYGCGCQHDCPYCYAKSLLEFRKLWDASNPRVADKDKILKALDKIDKGTILRLGGMTDPFQPLERDYGLNKWLIQELNSRGIGYLIVTKGDYLDSYVGDVLDKKLAHIQVSITSTDDNRVLEKYAPLPSKRMECADNLFNMGLDVQLRLSPFIQGYIEPDKIMDRDTDRLVIEFLRVNSKIEKIMHWMDFKDYTLKSGGYRHLPLEAKLSVLDSFRGKEVTVCEDVAEHYDYFKEHINPNKKDCCNLKMIK